MNITQVLITNDSDQNITGIRVYDRDNGGTLAVPFGTAFPTTDLVPGEIFWRTDLNALYRRNDSDTAWETINATPTIHGPTHIQGGTDEIDGDQLDIDYTPTNYTPDTGPAEVDDPAQLTSHLAGIDNALDRPLFQDLVTDVNTNAVTTTALYDPGNPPNDGLLTRVTLNVTVTEAGLYRLDYSYLWNHDSTSSDFVAVLYQDNTLIYLHRQEPKDSFGPSLGSSGTDQIFPASGFALLNLTAGSYTYTFSYGTSNASNESTIFTSDFMFYRVS